MAKEAQVVSRSKMLTILNKQKRALESVHKTLTGQTGKVNDALASLTTEIASLSGEESPAQKVAKVAKGKKAAAAEKPAKGKGKKAAEEKPVKAKGKKVKAEATVEEKPAKGKKAKATAEEKPAKGKKAKAEAAEKPAKAKGGKKGKAEKAEKPAKVKGKKEKGVKGKGKAKVEENEFDLED